MSTKTSEHLLDIIGDMDERYVQEYLDKTAQVKTAGRGRRKGRFTLLWIAAAVALLGTVSFAAAPAIGHFLANQVHERDIITKNFDEIKAEYAAYIGDTQECMGVTGTLNSVILEDHFILLSYTFNWEALEDAQDGSFHTWFLPWFFYITEGDNLIYASEYADGLHTQIYWGNEEEDSMEVTLLHCIDLEETVGANLVGKELTIRALYSKDGDGFVSTFTPKICFPNKSWSINSTHEFGDHRITLNSLRESALYVTLYIDCDTIGHTGDEYTFILSDELNNDYTPYPYGDKDTDGYWFTKPETMGKQLILKIIRGNLVKNSYGVTIDDSYEIFYEIPIKTN